MSGSIDFWTDPHRREEFGVFAIILLAEFYTMENGLTLAMSRETRAKLDGSLVAVNTPQLSLLEFPVNFERFREAKTVTNVTKWMFDSIEAAKVQSDDFLALAADGGSNAIGSISEFEVVARDEGRTKAADFNICFAHQNERSGGFASGTIEFAVNPNAELGEHLNKNHKIQTRMNRSGKRLGVYRDIQETKGRAPQLKPKPAGETRWQGKLNITLLSP